MAGKASLPAESSQEEPLVKAEDLFEPLAKLNKFRKYWKTREAILDGVPVYDMLNDEREKKGYFSAWAFNTAQSSLAAMPAMLVGVVLGFFGFKDQGETFAGHWFDIAWAVCIPFVLMLVAYTVGRFSLWKRDATKSARIRAARIYLYLDGTYGLYPQLVWSVVTIPQIFPTMLSLGPALNWLGMWQLIISMKTIPNELFPALGYWGGRHDILVHGTQVPSLFSSAKEDENAKRVSQTAPPIWKYRISVLVLAPAIAIRVAGGVLICVSIIAVLLGKT